MGASGQFSFQRLIADNIALVILSRIWQEIKAADMAAHTEYIDSDGIQNHDWREMYGVWGTGPKNMKARAIYRTQILLMDAAILAGCTSKKEYRRILNKILSAYSSNHSHSKVQSEMLNDMLS